MLVLLVLYVFIVISEKVRKKIFYLIRKLVSDFVIDFVSILLCGFILSEIIIIKLVDIYLIQMLSEFKIYCIIRLIFEVYVDSLSVLEVCGKYSFEKLIR